MRELISNIKNVFYWLPILWKDRWFSWEYLLDIIVHKLNSMEARFRTDSIKYYDYQIADEIAQVARILNDVRKDVYFNVTWRRAIELYGQGKIVCLEMRDDECPDDCSEQCYANTVYPDKPEGMTDEEALSGCCKLYREGDERRWSDLRKAMRLMGENAPEWWD